MRPRPTTTSATGSTSGPGRHRRTGRATRAGAMVLAAVGFLLVAGPASAQDGGQADDGLDEDGSTTWVVDPAGNRATATIELALRNTVPDSDAGRTFFDGYGIALPMQPTDVQVRLDGDDVDASVDELDDGRLVLDWDFPSRLFHDQTQDYEVVVEWDSAPPRTEFSQGPRITEAFVMLPIWAWGRDEVDLEVRVPEELDPRLGFTDPDTVRNGTAVFRREDAANFSEFLVGANDDGERTRDELDVDGTTVVVEAWADDPRWATRVSRFAGRALPALAAWTSTPLPDDTLTIRETARPVAEGWGGWNDPAADTISVGEEFDQALWTHELAHDWFDQDQFADTWLLEGLTEEVTESLAGELGIESPPEPAPTDLVLSEWGDILGDSGRDLVDDPEAWYATTSELYAGAHHVVDTVADEVGEQTFREIVRMTLQDASAWGDLGRESVTADAADWREFLDLAERVGESTTAREVIVTHVRPGAEDLLARRDRAIEEVDALADHPWGLPTSVAASMDAWRFRRAREQVEQALTARRAAAALADRADARGWTMPDLAESWRTGDLDVFTARVDALDAVVDDVEGLEARAEAAGLPRPDLAVDLDVDEVATTTDRVTGLRGAIDDLDQAERALVAVQEDPVANVGLAGTDPDRLLDRARSAFGEADLPAVRGAVAELDDVVDGATGRGRLRVGVVTTAVVALLALVVGVVLVRRRRREGTA